MAKTIELRILQGMRIDGKRYKPGDKIDLDVEKDAHLIRDLILRRCGEPSATTAGEIHEVVKFLKKKADNRSNVLFIKDADAYAGKLKALSSLLTQWAREKWPDPGANERELRERHGESMIPVVVVSACHAPYRGGLRIGQRITLTIHEARDLLSNGRVVFSGSLTELEQLEKALTRLSKSTRFKQDQRDYMRDILNHLLSAITRESERMLTSHAKG